MRTTQHKGDIATTRAIATFTQKGYDVSLPITESAAYDLVVDDGKGLHRVQVKFTTGKQVDLRRIHSNSNGYVVRKTKADDYDWLYIFRVSGEQYLVQECLSGRSSVNLNDKYRIPLEG